MHHDESADILGGRLQVSPPRPPLWSDPGRMTLLIGFAAVVAVAWTRIAPHYRQWRETRYRKAMRRRHGIPDDDHRPFNVAYAAALQARKKREGKSTGVTQRPPPVITVEDEPQVPSRNFDSTTGTSTSYHNSYAATDPHQTDSSPYSGLMTDAALPSTSQHSSAVQGVRSLGLNSVGGGASRPPTGSQFMSTRALHGKHALDDEMDVAPQTLAKKSRVDGEELIDGNEEPEWHVNGNELAIHQQPGKGKRGSKRVAGLDDEDDSLWGANRHDKRARKVSIDKSASAPEYDMDEDEPGDDLEESPTLTRGKKRDQAEAGSTFGGDDSVMDDDDEQPRRQRRRRMVSKKLSQSSRGQKRLRELDSYDSDDSEAERMRRAPTRKKRGKRSDEEMTPLSNDPLCKGRRIGEEWESNGVRYKVGPNGQRLRQELVKKSRSRFPMPSDSQHPDRRANVDVYVETWLTEEEYQAAKERHELAWQDTPPSPEPQSPGDVPDSPSKAGKSLLWSSTMSSRESPAKRGTLRQSIGPSTNLRLSLLSPTPASSNRRISSVHQVPASPGSDSPKLQKSRSYSKWEKQDLEAAAMLKIREKQQQQQKQAQQQEAKASLAPASGSSLLSGTAVTAAAASAKAEKAPQSSAPSFTFAPSSTSTSSTKPTTQAPNLSVPGPTTAAAKPATPTFPFPSSSNASASSAPSTSGAPTAAQPGVAQQDTQPSNSVPNFFAKPAAAASATPASSTSVPNFFAKPAEASGSSSAAPQAPTARRSRCRVVHSFLESAWARLPPHSHRPLQPSPGPLPRPLRQARRAELLRMPPRLAPPLQLPALLLAPRVMLRLSHRSSISVHHPSQLVLRLLQTELLALAIWRGFGGYFIDDERPIIQCSPGHYLDEQGFSVWRLFDSRRFDEQCVAVRHRCWRVYISSKSVTFRDYRKRVGEAR
ncbi:hypothetical protein BD414DRAFT_33275 [Trametes punicea]|nr:hypothetical protein BD414DRAFT_33275 [Trametes punicea]